MSTLSYRKMPVANRFVFGKAQIGGILHSFKLSILYPSCQFVYKRLDNIDVVQAEKNRGKSFVKILECFVHFNV